MPCTIARRAKATRAAERSILSEDQNVDPSRLRTKHRCLLYIEDHSIVVQLYPISTAYRIVDTMVYVDISGREGSPISKSMIESGLRHYLLDLHLI